LQRATLLRHDIGGRAAERRLPRANASSGPNATAKSFVAGGVCVRPLCCHFSHATLKMDLDLELQIVS